MPKATGCQEKLEIVRRHDNLLQNCSQLSETKILNSQEFDEQLDLTRSCIKSILFEINKKSKDFKFQQNMEVEF